MKKNDKLIKDINILYLYHYISCLIIHKRLDSMKIKSLLNKAISNPVIIIATFILLCVALYNGYPLVYSDTGTYIYSGFDLFVPKDRPVAYGLFIKLFSLNYSLWFVILVQNLITAYLIFEVFKLLFKRDFRLSYILTIVFLTFFTSIGWYSNQIMPDLFTPVFILCFFLLMFNKEYKLFKTCLISFIMIYASITHFSHILIGALLIASIAFIRIFLNKSLKNNNIFITIKRLVVVGLISASSWVIIPCLNYMVESEFSFSKGGHVFLMAHLNEKGVLKDILQENCDTKEFENCKICLYKDSLPTDIDQFIWQGDFLEKNGGWDNSKEEFDMIIRKSLTGKKYLAENIIKSVSYGVIQLAHNDIGEGLGAYNEGSAPYGQVHWRFNNELNDYLNSKQNKWGGVRLNFDKLITSQWIVLFISIIIMFCFILTPLLKKIDTINMVFLFFILISIILNSLVTAGLSAPYSRYSSRVVWLLPLAIIILVINNFSLIKQMIRSKD
jgi:hypothetical protein